MGNPFGGFNAQNIPVGQDYRKVRARKAELLKEAQKMRNEQAKSEREDLKFAFQKQQHTEALAIQQEELNIQQAQERRAVDAEEDKKRKAKAKAAFTSNYKEWQYFKTSLKRYSISGDPGELNGLQERLDRRITDASSNNEDTRIPERMRQGLDGVLTNPKQAIPAVMALGQSIESIGDGVFGIKTPKRTKTEVMELKDGRLVDTDTGTVISLPPAAAMKAADPEAWMNIGGNAFNRVSGQYAAKPGGTLSPRQQKANEIAGLYNLGPLVAYAVANDLVEFVPDPVSKKHTLESKVPGLEIPDALNRAARDLLTSSGAKEEELPPYTEDVMGAGTGPLDSLVRFAERIPVISDLVSGEEQTSAHLTLESLSKNFETAFANNPRFPVAEMDRIKKALSPPIGAFSSVSALKTHLQRAEQLLSEKVTSARSDRENSDLSPEARKAAESTVIHGGKMVSEIQRILQSRGEEDDLVRKYLQ